MNENSGYSKQGVAQTPTPILPPLKDRLSDEIHYYIGLKRHHALIMSTLRECGKKVIGNDLIYEQLVFASLDGLVVRLVNFTRRLHKLFDEVKANGTYLDSLKRKNWEGFKRDEPPRRVPR